MWKVAYNTLFLAALPVLAVISLFKPKLRRNFRERLLPVPMDQGRQGGIWIHAASLGEAVIAESLVAYLRGRSVDIPIVITTNTYYARDLLRRRHSDSAEIYSAPLDLHFSVARFMGTRRVDALVLIETEVWPNLIWMAQKRGIPVIILNGRISDSTVGRYKRLSFFLSKVLCSVDLVLAQSEGHAQRFVALGVEQSRVKTTGNLKYYRVLEASAGAPAKEAITFGSIREREIPTIVSLFGRLRAAFPHCPIYVAPRELHLVSEIERQIPSQLSQCRYSRMKGGEPLSTDIVVVDTVGDLLQIYAASIVAFVGGSLEPYGGQNVLEPIFVKTPVLFGPYVDNFRSVADEIIARNAGLLVHDGETLYRAIQLILEDAAVRQTMIEAGVRVLDAQRGSMKMSADMIMETIWKNSRSSSS